MKRLTLFLYHLMVHLLVLLLLYLEAYVLPSDHRVLVYQVLTSFHLLSDNQSVLLLYLNLGHLLDVVLV